MSLCRGCAGTGVDIAAPARAIQLAKRGVLITFPAGAKRKRDVMLTLDIYPLAELLDRLDQYLKLGGEPEHAFPLSTADLCSWCNGTGDPESQLTVHALEQAVTVEPLDPERSADEQAALRRKATHR